ncbi:unnamed protein product [Cladocopium goreaui]|uniref:Uncharacterized protein n=1 Tax=Cladocopium goreaui TaxID=2562237 RepID=A0A9P1BKF6_9DINO|nr:unnamed protein product [Cladocopium goreaui]
MHQLYLHYLSCKGNWEKCSLVVSVRKQFESSFRETFEFWDYKKMKEVLGEALADDLVDRHKKQEEKNPDFPNNELLWRYKNFAGVVEEKTKRVQHEAQLSAEATVDEEDFMENMILF